VRPQQKTGSATRGAAVAYRGAWMDRQKDRARAAPGHCEPEVPQPIVGTRTVRRKAASHDGGGHVGTPDRHHGIANVAADELRRACSARQHDAKKKPTPRRCRARAAGQISSGAPAADEMADGMAAIPPEPVGQAKAQWPDHRRRHDSMVAPSVAKIATTNPADIETRAPGPRGSNGREMMAFRLGTATTPLESASARARRPRPRMAGCKLLASPIAALGTDNRLILPHWPGFWGPAAKEGVPAAMIATIRSPTERSPRACRQTPAEECVMIRREKSIKPGRPAARIVDRDAPRARGRRAVIGGVRTANAVELPPRRRASSCDGGRGRVQ